MRHFKKPLFFGSGEGVLVDCYKLHKRLEEGFEILSGIQQMPFNKKEVKKGMGQIGDIVEDIAVALNCNNIIIKRKHGCLKDNQ